MYLLVVSHLVGTWEPIVSAALATRKVARELSSVETVSVVVTLQIGPSFGGIFAVLMLADIFIALLEMSPIVIASMAVKAKAIAGRDAMKDTGVITPRSMCCISIQAREAGTKPRVFIDSSTIPELATCNRGSRFGRAS